MSESDEDYCLGFYLDVKHFMTVSVSAMSGVCNLKGNFQAHAVRLHQVCRVRPLFVYHMALFTGCAIALVIIYRFINPEPVHEFHENRVAPITASQIQSWSRLVTTNTNNVETTYSSSAPHTLSYVVYNETELRHRINNDSKVFSRWDYMKPAMTEEERLTVRLLLKELVKICNKYNITDYFIFSGTLLGSYRHHGLQPWDDDVDILMRFTQRKEIFKAFTEYVNGSEELTAMMLFGRLKFFHKTRSVPITPYDHRWPFLDMSFYHENDTHIWELRALSESNIEMYHITPKDLIFPLHLRPFETLMMNSPRDAYAILKLLFSNLNCVPLTWVHRTEVPPNHESFDVNCEELKPIYPFVYRRAVGTRMEETLRLSDSVIHTVLTDEPTYAVCEPFVLRLVMPMDSNATDKEWTNVSTRHDAAVRQR